jgi:hypothetical protein
MPKPLYSVGTELYLPNYTGHSTFVWKIIGISDQYHLEVTKLENSYKFNMFLPFSEGNCLTELTDEKKSQLL